LITDKDWFAAISQSVTTANMEIDGIKLPGFPESHIVDLTITNGTSDRMLREASMLYSHVRDTAKLYGAPLERSSKILDFGCAWGRIARYFLRDIALENLYGVDVVPELVAACRKSFNSDNFDVIQQKGKLPHAKNTFDVAFANSVFSHLTPELNLKWMREIHRVLKPGGLAMLTIVTKEKFDVMAIGSKTWIDSLGFDVEVAKQDVLDGKFVWQSTQRGGELTGYGLAIIPPQWIEENWGQHFEGLDMITDYHQVIVVLRKKKLGFFQQLTSRLG